MEEQAVIGLNEQGKVVLISGQCKARDFKKQIESIKDAISL